MKCYKSGILWTTLTGLLLVSFQSAAVVISEAVVRSDGIFPAVADGGFDVLTAEVSASAIVDPRSASGWALASAEQGRLAFSLSSTVEANPSPATIAAGLSSTLAFTDTWDITPGGTGLASGAQAQVMMQIPLDGIVQLTGVPAFNSIVDFEVRANLVDLTSSQVYLDYSTGVMDPLQDFQVHQFFTLFIDVIVGSQLRVDSDMITTMNGTSFEPAGASGTNFISYDSLIRITQAPGFETLGITSEAGALTSPIPIPAALWLFGSGLIGLIGIARRKTA